MTFSLAWSPPTWLHEFSYRKVIRFDYMVVSDDNDESGYSYSEGMERRGVKTLRRLSAFTISMLKHIL